MKSVGLTPKGLKITAQPWYSISHDLQQQWDEILEEASNKLVDILLVHHERQIDKNNEGLSKTKKLISNQDVVDKLSKICTTKSKAKRPSSTHAPPHISSKKPKISHPPHLPSR